MEVVIFFHKGNTELKTVLYVIVFFFFNIIVQLNLPGKREKTSANFFCEVGVILMPKPDADNTRQENRTPICLMHHSHFRLVPECKDG